MTSSKVLFYLCFSFILGIFLNSVFPITPIFIWIFLLASSVLIIFSFYKKTFLVLGFCILFLCLGILRCQVSFFNIKEDKLSKLNDKPEPITLIGTVSSEPDNRDTVQRLKVKIENYNSTVLVTKDRFPEYNYSDKIQITGNLKTPAGLEGFNYKNYLLKDSIYSVMDFPKTEFLQKPGIRSPVSVVFGKVLWLKQKLRESIRQNYSPPESLILEGTILGDSGALSAELKSQLNITGLRHIIAVSGTHVVILSSILLSLFLLLGFWRHQAFYGSVAFIWLYILLTGLPASGVRAGIMATLFLLAEKLGRQSHSERIIVVSAAVMLFLNPLLLIYDVGFQLSFLAVLGLIYLQQPITDFLKFIVKNFKKEIGKKTGNLLNMFSATFAAQIFTIPIMLYNFGNVSFVAPLTNILILPIVEYLMIFGFLSSIAGVFYTCLPVGMDILGFVFAMPCYVFLNYFVKILEMFSKPWAAKTIENIHWVWVVVLYFLLAVLVKWVKKRQRESKFY